MKKRLLKKSRVCKLVNHSIEFLKYINAFFYPRIILSFFVFLLYFLMSINNYEEGVFAIVRGDLVVLGLLFGYLIYSAIFNFMRAIFCIRHLVHPIYLGSIDFLNGWLEFDYKDWETFKCDKRGFFATVIYDLVVFAIIIITISFITFKVMM